MRVLSIWPYAGTGMILYRDLCEDDEQAPHRGQAHAHIEDGGSGQGGACPMVRSVKEQRAGLLFVVHQKGLQLLLQTFINANQGQTR